jgi:hypothetical protein
MGTDVHAGKLPASASLAAVSPPTAVLHCLKRAEREDALVAILSNPADKAVTATLELNAAILGKVRRAEEVDLLERPLGASSVRVQGNRVSIKLPARGIASVQVRLHDKR